MKLSAAIDELVIATRAAGNSKQTALFYVRKLKPRVEYLEDRPVEEVTISDLRRFVADLRARNTRWNAHPHAWRHAFAREYLKNGGDLASLADYMSHADVQVTHASYAIFRTEELKTKHTQHSPLARLRETRH